MGVTVPDTIPEVVADVKGGGFEMEANGYVELFEDLKARVGSDDVALAIVEQVGKDSRVERMRSSVVQNGTNGEQPATGKQIAYLKALKVDVSEGLTKSQASELIDQHAQPS